MGGAWWKTEEGGYVNVDHLSYLGLRVISESQKWIVVARSLDGTTRNLNAGQFDSAEAAQDFLRRLTTGFDPISLRDDPVPTEPAPATE